MQRVASTQPGAAHAVVVGARPVIDAHAEIVAALRSRLGQAHADLLAAPRRADDGTLEWRTALAGPVQPASALPDDERRKLGQRAQRMLDEIRGLGQLLRAEDASAQLLGHQVEGAAAWPAAEQLYRVAGKPVVVLWGHAPAPAADPIVPVAPPLPPAAPPPAAVAAPARRSWWWLLGAPLGFAATLLLLQRCAPDGRTDLAAPLAEAEQRNRALAEQIAARRAEPPKFACVPEAPPPVARPVEPCSTAPLGPRPGEVALLFDASGSMRYSLGASEDEIEQLNGRFSFSQLMRQFATPPQAQHPEVRRLTREPTRISTARQAAVAVVERMPPDLGIGLVMADQCPQARSLGMFAPPRRPALVESLQRIEPRLGTPLADGLAKAARLVDGTSQEALIVVISDGTESCGGDPCRTAQELARRKPKLKINVVDIMGAGAGNCLARATGGRVYTATNAEEVATMTRQASQEAIGPADCRKP